MIIKLRCILDQSTITISTPRDDVESDAGQRVTFSGSLAARRQFKKVWKSRERYGWRGAGAYLDYCCNSDLWKALSELEFYEIISQTPPGTIGPSSVLPEGSVW